MPAAPSCLIFTSQVTMTFNHLYCSGVREDRATCLCMCVQINRPSTDVSVGGCCWPFDQTIFRRFSSALLHVPLTHHCPSPHVSLSLQVYVCIYIFCVCMRVELCNITRLYVYSIFRVICVYFCVFISCVFVCILQPFLNPEGGSECDVVLLNRWSVRNYQVQRGDIVSVMWVTWEKASQTHNIFMKSPAAGWDNWWLKALLLSLHKIHTKYQIK